MAVTLGTEITLIGPRSLAVSIAYALLVTSTSLVKFPAVPRRSGRTPPLHMDTAGGLAQGDRPVGRDLGVLVRLPRRSSLIGAWLTGHTVGVCTPGAACTSCVQVATSCGCGASDDVMTDLAVHCL